MDFNNTLRLPDWMNHVDKVSKETEGIYVSEITGILLQQMTDSKYLPNLRLHEHLFKEADIESLNFYFHVSLAYCKCLSTSAKSILASKGKRNRNIEYNMNMRIGDSTEETVIIREELNIELLYKEIFLRALK